MKVPNRRNIFLECICDNPGHSVRVELQDVGHSKYEPTLSITTKLIPQRTFWRRLVVGFKYIFRIPYNTSWDWDYESVELDDTSVDRLSSLIVMWRLTTKLHVKKKAEEARKKLSK